MASDDVLERVDRYLNMPGHWALEGGDTYALVEDLAAEVRALRKDRERLDWVLEHYSVECVNGASVEMPRWLECREDIDSAMAKEAGE